jgi:hypothetical protein
MEAVRWTMSAGMAVSLSQADEQTRNTGDEWNEPPYDF